MLTKFDAWLGRTVMHPLIIWICQRTGASQYAIASYAWMLAAWTLILRLSFDGLGSWIWAFLIVGVAFVETWFAAMNPDRPRRSSTALRLLILTLTLLDLFEIAIHTARFGFKGFNWGHAWDLFALIGVYAKTIQTIPPRKSPERKTSTRRVEA